MSLNAFLGDSRDFILFWMDYLRGHEIVKIWANQLFFTICLPRYISVYIVCKGRNPLTKF